MLNNNENDNNAFQLKLSLVRGGQVLSFQNSLSHSYASAHVTWCVLHTETLDAVQLPTFQNAGGRHNVGLHTSGPQRVISALMAASQHCLILYTAPADHSLGTDHQS